MRNDTLNSFCPNEAGGTTCFVDEYTPWLLLFVGNSIALLLFQCLAFGIGNWISPYSPNLAIFLNSILTLLFLSPVIFFIVRPAGGITKLSIPLLISFTSLYIYITMYCSWWLICLSVLSLIIYTIIGEKNKINNHVSYGVMGFYMLYLTCTYTTMNIFGFTTCSSIWIWIGLPAITTYAWLRPLFN